MNHPQEIDPSAQSLKPAEGSNSSPMSSIAPGRWVSDDGGLVDRRAFSCKHLYDRELKTVFAKSWLFLGHSTQIPKPGDFITTYMGETPVIVARAGDGSVHVSVNSCRHRGLRVCRTDSGNAATFECPYHGWTYGIKGELRGWPNVPGWLPVQDKTQWGLVKVRCDSYKGLLFGNFDADAAALIDYLGDFAFYIDSLVDRSSLGVEFLPGIQKRRVRTNWKLPTENLIGDRQHGYHSHRSAFGTMPAERREMLEKIISIPDTALQLATKGGHGAILTYFPEAALSDPWLLPSDWTAYAANMAPRMQASQAEALERLGDTKFRAKGNAMATFPNLTWLPFSCTLTVAHPRGPGTSELWSYFFYDRAWPAEVRDTLLANYYLLFGPSGSFEQDDIENWEEETAGSAHEVMANFPYSYQGALAEGLGQPHPKLAGLISSPHSDAPQRNFYAQWQEMVK